MNIVVVAQNGLTCSQVAASSFQTSKNVATVKTTLTVATCNSELIDFITWVQTLPTPVVITIRTGTSAVAPITKTNASANSSIYI